MVQRESSGARPRDSPQDRDVRPPLCSRGLSSHWYWTLLACSRRRVCGYAGFRLDVVAALGDVLVRLAAEHSSATSRPRADLLLAVVVPSKLPPCGMLG